MSNLINVELLTVDPDRQRQHFAPSAISDLAHSISEIGLLQPILIRQSIDDSGLRTIHLVAGERRLRAITYLREVMQQDRYTHNGSVITSNHLPYVELGHESQVKYYQAELEENILREDLTPVERASAVARLHELRMLQDPDHTVADTALELRGYAGGQASQEVRDSMMVSAALGKVEGLEKSKTIGEAKKLIERHARSEQATEVAAMFKAEQKSPHTLLHGDSRDMLPRFASQAFDVLITDPPYAVNADSFGSMSATRHKYEDSRDYVKAVVLPVLRTSIDLLKPKSHIYIFCAYEEMEWIRSQLTYDCGGMVDWWKRPLIWYKGNQGMLPKPGFGPRYTYECILFGTKGNRPTLETGHDVIAGHPQDLNPVWGAAKPPGLYEELLRRSANPGDFILDPFAGSGPAVVAANALSLRCTAIEKHEEAFGLMIQADEESR